jgi:hypothetical protein
VLQPIPGFTVAADVPERLDVVRGYLRVYGPATPRHVAGYLDAPLADVTARWPDDAVEVAVEGERRWALAADADSLPSGPATTTRLLGPFDPYLQTRDRTLLVPDPARATTLWPTLGRPGAVLVDGEVAGTWRPRKAGKRLNVRIDLWQPVPPAIREAVGEEAERLAAYRQLELAAVEVTG